MSQPDAEIKALGDTLIYEIINAVGLPKTASTQRTFDLLFHKAAGRLAEIGVTFDRTVRDHGFSRAAEQALKRID